MNPALLIYDGDCGFCTRSATWIQQRWPTDTASTVASQNLSDEELATLHLSREAVSEQVWWVDSAGHAVGAERAVSKALQATKGWWRYVGLVIDVAPLRWFSHKIYRLVAKNRHRLPGATASCAPKASGLNS